MNEELEVKNEDGAKCGKSDQERVVMWEYADTKDGAIVLMGNDANPQTGKDILYMNDDHERAKLIAKAPEMKSLLSDLDRMTRRGYVNLGEEINYKLFRLMGNLDT